MTKKSIITIYQGRNRREDKSNPYGFSTKYEIESGDTLMLAKAVEYDNCLAEYKGGYKKGENFIKADCILADIDNLHSDNENEWITHNDVIEALSNVEFYYYPSRNHMKSKEGRTPRPKEHYIFPIDVVRNVEDYTNIMRSLIEKFPHLHFDVAVKGGAQLNFGVENPKVEYVSGEMNLSECLDKNKSLYKRISSEEVISKEIIPQGERNTTLYKFACRILVRDGETKETYGEYIKETTKCSPCLEQKEIQDIWKSAVRFYNTKVKSSPDYKTPSEFNRHRTYKPKRYTDVGQAEVLSNVYDEIVRYSQQTEFLYYNENVWIEDNLKVRRLAQNLTDLQLKEARTEIKKAHELEDVSESDKKEAEKWAEVYRNYALKYQDSQKITATLREVQPMVQIDIQLLDEDGYKLNTPNGTIDLKTKELKKHNPKDYCTKITSVSPSNMGRELFDEFLNVITCEDTELKEYLQYVAGMIAIGKVFHENLIIAYGGGKNGKSTFFNLIAKVLGDYSGYLSSEVLTNDCRKNKGPEYAELRGKRFVITTELEEDVYLNTSIVKKLCSTDSIYAEKKYKAPFSFEPTHTIVLYTNHLPNVRAFDEGIWRRLVVIPFNAVIKKENEIKNYTEYLYEKAGGAVLNWIMEGAYMYIKDNHKIEMPTVVKNAIESYRLENDWIGNYLSERCVVEKSLKQASGRLFADYREYAKSIGEPIKSNAFFNNALKGKGFVIRKGTKGSFVYGLQLCSEMPQFECEKVLSAVSMTDNDAEMQENDEVVF